MSAIPSMAINNTLLLVAIAALLICAALIIGVFVYRDAKRRGMYALRWALIAALAPALMGFIIYLLTRTPRTDGKSGSSGIGIVIVSLIVIPFLLLYFASLLKNRDSGIRIKTVTKTALTFEEYCEEKDAATSEKVRSWLDTLPKVYGAARPPVHMLRYDSEYRGEPRRFYLAALPCTGRSSQIKTEVVDGLFASTLRIDAQPSGGYYNDYTLYSFSLSGNEPDKFKAIISAVALPVEISVVDYNPSVLYIVPDYSKVELSGDLFLPDKLHIGKHSSDGYIGSSSHSFVADMDIDERSEVFEILKTIDSAELIEDTEAHGQTYSDLFTITTVYESRSGHVTHWDSVTFWVTLGKESGDCIIFDESRNDVWYMKTDRAFYDRLSALFEP
ncbi:MAG: hypothetical protein IKZ82_10355 [Clostridia bacterium]|nr:hypothetical protein [Clostridia bacterium]